MRIKNIKVLIVATSVLIISFGSVSAVDNYRQVHADQVQIERLEGQQRQLRKDREKLQHDSKQQQDQHKQSEDQLRQEIERLKVVKAERERRRLSFSSSASAASPAPSAAVLGCGDNSYANYIYMHESGCRLRAPNGSGCDGIGQACPASKLLAVCPGMDYACQNAFFTAYANAAYGGWAGAYSFWLSHHWW